MSAIAVMGGSGLYELHGLRRRGEHRVQTPYGTPSDTIVSGELDGVPLLFLPRHGVGHRLLPSEVPFAANVYALKNLGARRLLSVSAVGSLREALHPGDVVLPDQFIDRTVTRRSTFFGDGVVGHVSLAEPTCSSFRSVVHAAAMAVDPRATDGGTYVCIEGPQFSTRAESNLYRQWGCDIVGMTNATEAKLAREAGLCYASLSFVTDYDCWKADEAHVTVEQIVAVLRDNVRKGQAMLSGVVARASTIAPCACGNAAVTAVITAAAVQPAATAARLKPLLDVAS